MKMQSDGPRTPGEPLRWSQEERLRTIEALAFWDDRVNRGDLMRRFGISVPQATNDLRRYQELAPANLRYDTREKTYRASDAFAPIFGPPSGEAWLSGMADKAGSSDVPVVHTPLPPRSIDPWVLRQVLAAARERKSLRVMYQPMDQPEPGHRWVSPRALANDGQRWHIRAYNYDLARYEDLLFPRIMEIEGERPSGPIPPDEDWDRIVDVRLRPASRLSPTQRQVVARDYGMTEGETVVPTRAALLFLFLRRLGVDRADALIELVDRAIVDAELQRIDSRFRGCVVAPEPAPTQRRR